MGERVYLGIEIGGTKLQFGLGSGVGGPLTALQRCEVDRRRGAEGIREQIARVAGRLTQRHAVRAVGVGFGGPVDAARGRVVKSFQIDGWDGFPLRHWCQTTLGRPTAIENDSNLAGLGEASFGAGRGARVVFYSNVGSGIGGALVIDGHLYAGGSGVAVAEVGHLRPGPTAEEPSETVESVASGWGMAAVARRLLSAESSEDGPQSGAKAEPVAAWAEGPAIQPGGMAEAAAELLARCDGDVERLTGKMVIEAAAEGNRLAEHVLRQAVRTYGWALAQAITLLAPEVVVVGGGVAQVGEALFFGPLREQVARYVMPPLRGTYRLVPAALGEEVVVHGALALAASIGAREANGG